MAALVWFTPGQASLCSNPPTDMEEEFSKSTSFWPRFWRISIASKISLSVKDGESERERQRQQAHGWKSALEKDLPVGH